MTYNYYFEDIGNGNQCWFVWNNGLKTTTTAISLHGARELATLLNELGFRENINLKTSFVLNK